MSQYPAPYKIALLQMDCAFLDREANLAKAEKMIREAAAGGARLVCMPEAFNIGYLGSQIPDMMALAETEDGPSLTRMKALARELGVFLLCPIFYRVAEGVENTAFLIRDDGEIIGHYSKTHPVGAEQVNLHRGTDYPVFDTKLGRIGVVICYDACFPETVRLLALHGAELVLVPAAWRASYYFKEWWDINISCRALDDLTYVAAINRCGPSGEEIFAGKTQLCDPLGSVMATCGVEEEAILYGEIDIARVAKEREFNTVLIDRHPEDYKDLLNKYEIQKKE